MRFIILILLVTLMSTTALLMAQETSAGLASTDITPEKPMALTGYGGRPAPYESVQQRIKAKALVIGTDVQRPAVMITTDLIGFPMELSDALAERLKKSGIS